MKLIIFRYYIVGKSLEFGCGASNLRIVQQMNQDTVVQKLDTLIEKVDELRSDLKDVAKNVNQNTVNIAKTSTDMGWIKVLLPLFGSIIIVLLVILIKLAV